MVRSAKPPGIPEEIARRYSPVFQRAPSSRDDIPEFAGWGGFAVPTILCSVLRSGGTFLVPSSERHDDSDTRWRCYEARHSCARENSRRHKMRDHQWIRHRLNRSKVPSVTLYIYMYMYAYKIDVSDLRRSSVCQGQVTGGIWAFRSVHDIPLSCFDVISIAVECARSNFYLLFQIQCAIYFR